jgi:YD repeat-containing protein
MSDLSKWNLHGSVRRLHTEFAEWDLAEEVWKRPRHSSHVRFRPDGKILEYESHNADGSVSLSSSTYDGAGRLREIRISIDGRETGRTIYSYDSAGRLLRLTGVGEDGTERELEAYDYRPDGKKTKTYFVPKREPNVGFAYSIEDTDESYGASDAAEIATDYGPAGASEVRFRDAEGRVLRRLILSRDEAGRLATVSMHPGDPAVPPELQSQLENLPEGARSSAASLLGGLLGPQTVTTYSYDPQGRLLERRMRMGDLGDHRSAYRYNDSGNKIEENIENTSREVEIDDEGKIHPIRENSWQQHVRLDYQYDPHGNWTERVVCSRLAPNPNFERSNIERREIEYSA